MIVRQNHSQTQEYLFTRIRSVKSDSVLTYIQLIVASLLVTMNYKLSLFFVPLSVRKVCFLSNQLTMQNTLIVIISRFTLDIIDDPFIFYPLSNPITVTGKN